ncbi:MAG: energy transducer TonB [Blastocatellales bacterium]|nr:energy transducer TonB [Nitrosomonas nitrosa]
MKSWKYLFAWTLFLTINLYCPVFGQDPNKDQSQIVNKEKERPVKIRLRSGETVAGIIVRVDSKTVDFTVKGILQSVSLDKVDLIEFDFVSDVNFLSDTNEPVYPGTASLKPKIKHKEKAVYTSAARAQNIQGIVVLSVVFASDGTLKNIQVVKGLPFGLIESSLYAASKIKFDPAKKDGKPVSVRGILEFSFALQY